MSYSYDKRRASQAGHEGQQLSSRGPMGTFLPDAANSAQLAMLGFQDTRGGAADLKAAMDAKAASLIGANSGPLGRFGPDHDHARRGLACRIQEAIEHDPGGPHGRDRLGYGRYVEYDEGDQQFRGSRRIRRDAGKNGKTPRSLQKTGGGSPH